jgi:hypothetical protein
VLAPVDLMQGGVVVFFGVAPFGDDVLDGEKVGPVGVGAGPQCADLLGGAHRREVEVVDLVLQRGDVFAELVVLFAQRIDVGQCGFERGGRTGVAEVVEGRVAQLVLSWVDAFGGLLTAAAVLDSRCGPEPVGSGRLGGGVVVVGWELFFVFGGQRGDAPVWGCVRGARR